MSIEAQSNKYGQDFFSELMREHRERERKSKGKAGHGRTLTMSPAMPHHRSLSSMHFR